MAHPRDHQPCLLYTSAVVDPLAASAASSNEVSAAQARPDVLAAENADYAELNAQYDRYVVPGLSEEERNLVDRDVVLNLLQQKVMGVGHLSSLRMEKNTATVTCLGADLNEVSDVYKRQRHPYGDHA